MRAAAVAQHLSLHDYASGVCPDLQQVCFDFIVGRLQNILLEKGYRYDVVNAVLAEQGGNPSSALRNVIELSTWVEKKEWSTILPAFSRCVRITRDIPETFTVKPEKFITQEEKSLFARAEKASSEVKASVSINTFATEIEHMVPVINQFFDGVLVMDKDTTVKENRLAILQRISGLSKGIVDLSQLEGF